jgi:hypothetical protein
VKLKLIHSDFQNKKPPETKLELDADRCRDLPAEVYESFVFYSKETLNKRYVIVGFKFVFDSFLDLKTEYIHERLELKIDGNESKRKIFINKAKPVVDPVPLQWHRIEYCLNLFLLQPGSDSESSRLICNLKSDVWLI